MSTNSTAVQILKDYLLGGELSNEMSLKSFQNYFPEEYRSSPQVKDLYRHFQDYRSHIRETISKNIALECTLSGWKRQDGVKEIVDEDGSKVQSSRSLPDSIAVLKIAENKLKAETLWLEKQIQEDYLPTLKDWERQLSEVDISPTEEDINHTEILNQLKDLSDFCDGIEVAGSR